MSLIKEQAILFGAKEAVQATGKVLPAGGMAQTVTADAEVSEEDCTKICDSMASATAEQYAEDAETCREDDASPDSFVSVVDEQICDSVASENGTSETATEDAETSIEDCKRFTTWVTSVSFRSTQAC